MGYISQESNPLDFIINGLEDAYYEGLIYGLGEGESADKHYDAFMTMIKNARDSIEKGNLEAAYFQLKNAYKRIDGEPKPPDFIGGSDVDHFIRVISMRMADLEYVLNR